MPKDVEEFYSRHAERHADAEQFDKMPERVVEYLETFTELLPGRKILDAGCGPGRDATYFTEHGFDVTGIDVADGMVEYARGHAKGTFRIMDMRDMTFDDGSFDGVWCSASIFFVPPTEMRRALQEFNRVLMDRGVVYVAFKLGDGEHLKEKGGERVREYHLSAEQASELLHDTGFNEVETHRAMSPNGNEFLNCFYRKSP